MIVKIEMKHPNHNQIPNSIERSLIKAIREVFNKHKCYGNIDVEDNYSNHIDILPKD